MANEHSADKIEIVASVLSKDGSSALAEMLRDLSREREGLKATIEAMREEAHTELELMGIHITPKGEAPFKTVSDAGHSPQENFAHFLAHSGLKDNQLVRYCYMQGAGHGVGRVDINDGDVFWFDDDPNATATNLQALLDNALRGKVLARGEIVTVVRAFTMPGVLIEIRSDETGQAIYRLVNN